MPPRLRWPIPLFAFAVFTTAGLSKFVHFWLDDMARGHTDTLLRRLIEELTGAYAMGLIFAAMIWVVGRYPLDRQSWVRRLPGYALLVVGFALLHTTLMWVSREVLFPLVGLGTYDYGMMQFRYPMEFATQAPDMVLLLTVIHGWRWYRRNRQRELRTAQLEGELSQARLARLEAQLRPHFLFNTLNAISSLMYRDPVQADRMLGRLADLLRLTFQSAGDPEVPLSAELEWLGWYLEIMQLRFGDRLTVRHEIEPEVLGALVPRLILQPLVENALRHGASQNAGPASVTILARRYRQWLQLTVLDDGPGVPDPELAVGTGVGLSNTAERIRALYGEQGRFTLENRAEGGVAATIQLPLRTGGSASNGAQRMEQVMAREDRVAQETAGMVLPQMHAD